MSAKPAVAPYMMGNVAHDIKVLRSCLGLNQREMAERLGITQQYLCDVEHGRRRLPDERIMACEVMGIRGALISSRICEYEATIRELRRAETSPRPVED